MYINLFWVVYFHEWNSLFLKRLASGHVNISLQGSGKASFACPTCFFEISTAKTDGFMKPIETAAKG